MGRFAIDVEDVRRAAATIAGHVLRTPLVSAPRLSELTGATVFVKHENMHPTGAFKERGAVNKLASLRPEERRRGVIAMSAGNHAQAVAYHAKRLGIPATIVMPALTPLVKVESTRAHGATVVLEGEGLAESGERAHAIAESEGLAFVHPYDDALVMAGQGTVALEILADCADLDQLVVPIGGGGLISGIAVAAKALHPTIEIIGVQAALYPSFFNLVLVEEATIERAVNAYATLQRTMAEGAGAAGLAAMLARPDLFRGRRVGLVLCGGNIDARLLASVMVRELEREDRIASFRITSHDRPGFLGRVASRLGALGANILEVSHGRLFLDVPAKGVTSDVTIETRGAGHTAEILAALTDDGLDPQRINHRGLSETAY